MMIPTESEILWLEDFAGYMHFEPIPEPMTKQIKSYGSDTVIIAKR